MSNIFDFKETEKMGLRKGVVFYFNDWIEEKIISILEEIVEQFLFLTQMQFTKKRNGDSDAYVNRRNIRGGWKKVFHRAFDNFDSSNILVLDNCTPQQLQTIYTCIKLTNYRVPSINYFVYSYLCFQFPLDIEWSTVYQFIEYVNSKYTEWDNIRLSTRFGVPCPNFIQVLYPELMQKMGSEIPNELHTKLVNSNLFLDILDRKSEKMFEPTLEQIGARHQKLYRLLKPLLVSPERSMFMKKEDYEKRLKRFEEIL